PTANCMAAIPLITYIHLCCNSGMPRLTSLALFVALAFLCSSHAFTTVSVLPALRVGQDLTSFTIPTACTSASSDNLRLRIGPGLPSTPFSGGQLTTVQAECITDASWSVNINNSPIPDSIYWQTVNPTLSSHLMTTDFAQVLYGQESISSSLGP